MRFTLGCGIGLVALLHGVAFAEGARVLPAEKIDWQEDERLPGVKSYVLWGDPSADEEHAMLRTFPAGYAPPRHAHPSTESVVVISGKITVEHEGAGETVLGPGSYSEIPANMSHAVRCMDAEDCVFVLRAPGLFTIDFDEMAQSPTHHGDHTH